MRKRHYTYLYEIRTGGFGNKVKQFYEIKRRTKLWQTQKL